MQPTDNGFNYSALESEIYSLNNNLQLFTEPNPSVWGRLWKTIAGEPKSLGVIQHLLSDNSEHLYFYKPEGVFPYVEARDRLAGPLAELKKNVVRLYPDSKEKRSVVAQLQRINEIVTPLPDSEKELHALEAELKVADPSIEFERDPFGRMIDPDKQLRNFKAEKRLNKLEAQLKAANPPLEINFKRNQLGRIIDADKQLEVLTNDLTSRLVELYTFFEATNHEWAERNLDLDKISLATALQIVQHYPFIGFVSECYRNNPARPAPDQDIFQTQEGFSAAKNYAAALREWFAEQSHEETSLKLSILQPEIALFSKVTNLEYEGNVFVKPCEEVYHLNLQSLTTTSPNLDFSRFNNLEHLTLTAFWMDPQVPEGIFRMLKLQTLDLKWFKFNGGIPEELGNLRNLRVLNVAGCNFSQFPETLKTMGNLTTVKCGPWDLSKLRSVVDPQKSLLSKIELVTREMNHSGATVIWEADGDIPLKEFLDSKRREKPTELL